MNFQSFFRRCAAVASMSVACLLAPSAHASVVLHVNGSGILTGASGITVGIGAAALPGTYSVRFVDGTCAAVFGACDVAHFTFTSQAGANAASQALLDYVLIDSPAGQFDSVPNFTSGCGNDFSCNVYTPYAVSGSPVNVFYADAFNLSVPLPAFNPIAEGVLSGSFPVTATLSPRGVGAIFIFRDTATWAEWILGDVPAVADPASVPEPGTLALLGLAGVALAWTQRRRRPGAHVQ